MNTVSTEGIVLRRMNYGESDRIITMLTKDHGKISLLAKGVRKQKSKLAGGIELFSISQISYIDGNSDLKILTSSQLTKHFGDIVKDLDKTMFGYEVLQIMNKHAEGHEGGAMHQITVLTFEALHDAKVSLQSVATWFYVRLLDELGMSLNTATDDKGDALSAEKSYHFDAPSMSLTSHPDGLIGASHIKLLRILHDCSPKALAKIAQLDDLSKICLPLTKTAYLYHHP